MLSQHQLSQDHGQQTETPQSTFLCTLLSGLSHQMVKASWDLMLSWIKKTIFYMIQHQELYFVVGKDSFFLKIKSVININFMIETEFINAHFDYH